MMSPLRISHEAIYQALYVQGRGALKRELREPRVRTILERWGMDGTTDDAILVVSELLTNTIRDGAADRATVELVHHDDRVRIAVHNETQHPFTRVLGPSGVEQDRGLRVVDAIAIGWGVDRRTTLRAEVSFP